VIVSLLWQKKLYSDTLFVIRDRLASLYRKLSGWWDSNSRHSAWEADKNNDFSALSGYKRRYYTQLTPKILLPASLVSPQADLALLAQKINWSIEALRLRW